MMGFDGHVDLGLRRGICLRPGSDLFDYFYDTSVLQVDEKAIESMEEARHIVGQASDYSYPGCRIE